MTNNVQISIDVTIAGFIIRLKLEGFNKKNIENNFITLRNYFKHYIIKRTGSDVFDYCLKIVEPTGDDLIFKKSRANFYLKLFTEVSKTKGVCTSNLTSFQFDLIMRCIIQSLLTRNDGIFLHASANLVRNKATLFTGPTGAGKSTISNLLSKRFTKLEDDLCVVRKINNKYFFYQTPFLGKNRKSKKLSESYQVERIFIIHQNVQNKLTKLRNSNLIIKSLLKQVIGEPNKSGYYSRILFELSNCVPVTRLFFNIKISPQFFT